MNKYAILLTALLLQPVQAKDNGQWEETDPATKQWYRNLMQPDNPFISCCGEADAYYADSWSVDPTTGETIAIITDDRENGPLNRIPIPNGSRITVPKNKMKWDKGNPTGHGVIFIGSSGQVLCYVQPGGV